MKIKNYSANSTKKGFTLLELIVVIAIIAILGALVLPNFIGRLDSARIDATKADLRTISSALMAYKVDNARYPTTEQGLLALVERPNAEPVPKNWKQILPKLPKDPWGNQYQYIYPGEHSSAGEFDLFSYGADGQPGGQGNDAEIGNWDL